MSGCTKARWIAEEDAVFISVSKSKRHLYRAASNSTSATLIAEHTGITNAAEYEGLVAYDAAARRLFWSLGAELGAGGIYIVNLNETDIGNVMNETTMTLVSPACARSHSFLSCT